MKVRRVNRYYCDFCKKANCSGASISTHEQHCTKNPKRTCRMCKVLLEQEQPSTDALLATLPDPEQFKRLIDGTGGMYYFEFGDALGPALTALRKAAGNCPACIMAACRQKGIPVVAFSDFNFTKESKSLWADYNDARSDHY